MTETLCDSGAVKLKCGANVSTALTAENYTQLINEAEGFISSQARYDYVTNYANVSDIGQALLKEAASSLAAIGAINYDMSGYSSRTEAQVMLDVNYAKVVDCVNMLIDDKNRKFVKDGEVS